MDKLKWERRGAGYIARVPGGEDYTITSTRYGSRKSWTGHVGGHEIPLSFSSLVRDVKAVCDRHRQNLADKKTERCVAKVGEPFRMSECGARVEYRTVEQAQREGDLYSGWVHADRIDRGHHGVPASWL